MVTPKLLEFRECDLSDDVILLATNVPTWPITALLLLARTRASTALTTKEPTRALVTGARRGTLAPEALGSSNCSSTL